jgi:hypothetical protein
MKINELVLTEDQLDELSLKGIGQGIGAAAGALGRGAGHIQGAWQGAKDAFTQNKNRIAPAAQRNVAQGGNAKATPQQPAAQQPAAQQPSTTDTITQALSGKSAAPAAAPAAQQPAAAPAGQTPPANPQQAAAADQQAKLGVGQINKIIPTLRTRDLQSVKKNVDATIAKKQTTAAPAQAPQQPAAPAQQPAASPAAPQPQTAAQQPAPEDDNPNIVRGYNEGRTVKFKSNFLGMEI